LEKKQVSAMAKPKALSVPPHAYQINPDAALGSPVSSGSNRAPNTRNELKTAAELAAMIESDFAQHPDAQRAVSALQSTGQRIGGPCSRHRPPVEFANRKSGGI
jgi:hypothetical protein